MIIVACSYNNTWNTWILLVAFINITVTVYLAIKTTANLVRTHVSIQISLIYDLFITLAVLAQSQSMQNPQPLGNHFRSQGDNTSRT